MEEGGPGEEWRAALRRHRRERRLSLPEVARRSGLSLSAVKAYERGDRQPSRRALEAVLEAIGLPHDAANPIRAGAGFATAWHAILDRRYVADLGEFRRHADERPWPVFITNQGTYVVHWNRAFEALLDLDVAREFPDPLTRNLLSGAVLTRFAQCLVNYDEALEFLLGLVKGDPRERQDLDRPAAWNRDQMQRLSDADPGELRRLLDAWDRAVPVAHKVRHQYRIAWRHRGTGPVLRFIGQLTVCDLWNELSWLEWTPADAATWLGLEALLAAAGAAPRP